MPSVIPPSSATAVASAAAITGRKGRLAQAFGKMTGACPAQVQEEWRGTGRGVGEVDT